MVSRNAFNRILGNIIGRRYDSENGERYFQNDLIRTYRLHNMPKFSEVYERAWLEASDTHTNLEAVLVAFDNISRKKQVGVRA